MFNNISWQGYWITIALLTAGYYLVIYLLYFRKAFSMQWNKNSTPKEGLFSPDTSIVATAPSNGIEQLTLFQGAEDFQFPQKDSLESAVYACMDEVAAYLEGAKGRKCVKEELLYALNAILRKYPAIAGSEYKVSVTNVLVTQCEYHCAVHLSAEDVARVWVRG